MLDRSAGASSPPTRSAALSMLTRLSASKTASSSSIPSLSGSLGYATFSLRVPSVMYGFWERNR
eukprot:CAMPEP_0114158308 /NCGR_PEP_ID=MMETSP0043_2-20121206/27134_1 /TAXON_ID=464988 /ORGANISM="Hemiselmis andersenii, Strain CCMP644" /LENGTH=63 /DNA_ID=CAMNT_0001254031 /DNA_START=196 /DNA_END=384 /DNA_ORIENTATION=-